MIISDIPTFILKGEISDVQERGHDFRAVRVRGSSVFVSVMSGVVLKPQNVELLLMERLTFRIRVVLVYFPRTSSRKKTGRSTFTKNPNSQAFPRSPIGC